MEDFAYIMLMVMLFKHKKEIELIKLKDICNIKKGTKLDKKRLKSEPQGDFIYLTMDDGINSLGYFNNYNCDAKKITISQGETSIGFVNLTTQQCWLGSHCYYLELKSQAHVKYKYLYYVMKERESLLMTPKYQGVIPSLSIQTLQNLIVAIPSLETQDEIIKTLDALFVLKEKLDTFE